MVMMIPLTGSTLALTIYVLVPLNALFDLIPSTQCYYIISQNEQTKTQNKTQGVPLNPRLFYSKSHMFSTIPCCIQATVPSQVKSFPLASSLLAALGSTGDISRLRKPYPKGPAPCSSVMGTSLQPDKQRLNKPQNLRT